MSTMPNPEDKTGKIRWSTVRRMVWSGSQSWSLNHLGIIAAILDVAKPPAYFHLEPSFPHDIPDPTPSTVLNDWLANLEKRYRVWAEQSPQRTAARQYKYHTSRNSNTLPWRRQYPYPAKGKAFEPDPKNPPIISTPP